jgi:hypothetical protein
MYRIQEVDEKARLKSEADANLERSAALVLEYAPNVPECEGDAAFPPTRLQHAEAVVLLERCVVIYGGYGDDTVRKRAERRLEASKWALERQIKACKIARAARDLALEYIADKTINYKPTAEYHYGKMVQRRRAVDSLGDLELAGNLFADAKDAVNQELCMSLVSAMRDIAMHTNMACRALEEAQSAEKKYTYDVKLKQIIVFGGRPLRESDPPRQPYARHKVASDYPLRDETAGVQFQRLMLDEAMAAYAKAKRVFEMAGDVHNMHEASRQEDAVNERRKVLQEGYELVKEGQACIRSRQYAAGYEKYLHAANLLRNEARDIINATYVDQLVEDAATKRSVGEDANRLMAAAKELVSTKDSFECWQDVVAFGLDAFARAEVMYSEAAALYGKLDDDSAQRSALDLQKDAEERKVCAHTGCCWHQCDCFMSPACVACTHACKEVYMRSCLRTCVVHVFVRVQTYEDSDTQGTS